MTRSTNILIRTLMGALLPLVFGSSIRSEFQDLKFRSEAILTKIVKEYQVVEKDVEVEIAHIFEDMKSMGNANCYCKDYTCGCCLHLEVEKISLNDTACINITYLPDEYGFEFIFSLNGDILIKEKVSVKNPPPLCAAIPFFHKLASLCLRFYDLDYKEKQFSGCADIEAKLEGVIIKKYDLGCFHIPP